MSTSFTVFKQDAVYQYYCRWTEKEDMLLTKAVADYGPHKWAVVSKFVPGRTAIQCSTRWFGALNPNVHKGRWSKDEDEALTDAVRYFQMMTYGNNTLLWNKIAENIPHRTGIQCQARWTEALDPAVRKGRWRPEEDRQLEAAIEIYGRCWIRVASMIPTRTQRQCRTRWNQILKASIPKSKKKPDMPSEASITIKQDSQDTHHFTKSDPCIIISASPIIDHDSPSGSRPSLFSSESPTASVVSFSYDLSNNISMPKNIETFDLAQSKDPEQNNNNHTFYHNNNGLLPNNSDLDFLISYLEYNP